MFIYFGNGKIAYEAPITPNIESSVRIVLWGSTRTHMDWKHL